MCSLEASSSTVVDAQTRARRGAALPSLWEEVSSTPSILSVELVVRSAGSLPEATMTVLVPLVDDPSM